MPLEPGLYVVATPIGNLGDITLRAIETLKSCDRVYCEDTRVTRRLFSAHGIETPLSVYHDHSDAHAREAVLAELSEGRAIALVSDAGTPLISDPGFKLVRAAAKAGVAIVPIPGASASLAALSAAGLPTDQFYFAGFPPAKSAARQRFFEGLSSLQATLIFYESGPRLSDSLLDMEKAFGPRAAVVARELTKKFEELRRGALGELASSYAGKSAPKGEIVVLVDRSGQQEASDADIDDDLRLLMAEQTLKSAVDAVAENRGVARKRVYARALVLKKAGSSGREEADR